MLGARQNAFTSKEVTCYYADFIDESLPGVFALLADMVSHSTIEQQACELEREVVIEEIARSEDDPENVAHELFTSLAWPKHTLGLPIAGTRETVGSFGHEQGIEFRNKHYFAQNCVVAAAGNVDHEQLVELTQRLLVDLPQTGSQDDRVGPDLNQGIVEFKFKETEQSHLFTGQSIFSSCDGRRFALMLANNILGGSMSSRLFQEVREKLGLAYSIYSYPQLYSDGGLFAVYAGTRPENGQFVFDTIESELRKFGSSDVTNEELERAKASVKGALALSLESTSRRMIRIAEATIIGTEVLDFYELLDIYNKTTLDEVHSVAHDITDTVRTTAVVGPYDGQSFSEYKMGEE
jgi:predicted Zn-dependent peptidase